MEEKKRTMEDYASHETPVWCPGCGDAGVLAAVKRVCVDLEIDPSRLAVVTGIGCSSKISEYLNCYGFHWLHGRLVPVAMAIHAANPNLIVLGMGGDGDGYAIGMEHFIHACRRNPDMVYVVMNNMIYGLTKGQASPTTHQGLVTATTPFGARERPVDGVELALSAGATFVARAFSYSQKELVEILKRAIAHHGFSFVEVLSPCPQYHREPEYEHVRDWYRDRIQDIVQAWDEMKSAVVDIKIAAPDYDPHDAVQALTVIRKIKEEGKIATGVIYIEEGAPTFEENHGIDVGHSPVDRDISVEANRSAYEELVGVYQ